MMGKFRMCRRDITLVNSVFLSSSLNSFMWGAWAMVDLGIHEGVSWHQFYMETDADSTDTLDFFMGHDLGILPLL